MHPLFFHGCLNLYEDPLHTVGRGFVEKFFFFLCCNQTNQPIWQLCFLGRLRSVTINRHFAKFSRRRMRIFCKFHSLPHKSLTIFTRRKNTSFASPYSSLFFFFIGWPMYTLAPVAAAASNQEKRMMKMMSPNNPPPLSSCSET